MLIWFKSEQEWMCTGGGFTLLDRSQLICNNENELVPFLNIYVFVFIRQYASGLETKLVPQELPSLITKLYLNISILTC